jgi:hypothetical protein
MCNRFKIATLIAVSALIAGGLALQAEAFSGGSLVNGTEPPSVVQDAGASANGVASSAGCSYADPRCLVGFNQEVFVGKVLNSLGNANDPVNGSENDRFEVRVIYNIKGKLTGNVVLAQIVIPEASPVQVGATYIFSAIYSLSSGWYAFGSREAYQLVTTDQNLSDAQLLRMARRDTRVVALEQAYPFESLAGNQPGTAYNSYATRCLDASGSLIDDTVQHEREKQGLPKDECVTLVSSIIAGSKTEWLLVISALLVIVAAVSAMVHVLQAVLRRRHQTSGA